MASSKNYLELVLDLLRKCDNITYKKMMGEFLLYSNGTLFGGVYDNRFLVKVTQSNSIFDMKLELPYDGAKRMYLVDSEDIDQVFLIVSKTLVDLKEK